MGEGMKLFKIGDKNRKQSTESSNATCFKPIANSLTGNTQQNHPVNYVTSPSFTNPFTQKPPTPIKIAMNTGNQPVTSHPWTPVGANMKPYEFHLKR